jgi:hypothetical protein
LAAAYFNSDGLARLLFFECDRDGRIAREPYFPAIDVRDKAEIDEMMVARMSALAGIGLCKFDALVIDAVDRSDVDTVRADHFHMGLDLAGLHFVLLT